MMQQTTDGRRGLEAVRRAAEDRRAAELNLDHAVAAARKVGSSWAEIGDAVGISRQSAHERWRRIDPGEQPQSGESRRALTDTEIDVEVAGIKAGLEMGGLTFTADAERTARAVLAGEMTADEAIARGNADILRRHGL